MSAPYPPGYLNKWMVPLPKSRKPRNCRYCGVVVDSAYPHPVCLSDECRARYEAHRKEAQRRYQRKYDQKRRAS